MISFVIKGRLDNLNDYIKECRKNCYAGNNMKRKNQARVEKALIKYNIAPIKHKIYLLYKWYEPNSRRDLDNIAFGHKFIQDAMVAKGIIVDDGWKYIGGFKDEFYVDKNNPRIEVYIYSEYEYNVLVN